MTDSQLCYWKKKKKVCPPAGSIDGLLIRRRHGEADGRHHGFVACGTDHLPLGALSVVLQHAFLAAGYRDLTAVIPGREGGGKNGARGGLINELGVKMRMEAGKREKQMDIIECSDDSEKKNHNLVVQLNVSVIQTN